MEDESNEKMSEVEEEVITSEEEGSKETPGTSSEEQEENTAPEDEQMYSALSFAVMLIVIGIPLWWKTTEVYRVSLPHRAIYNLDELHVNITMNIHVVTLEKERGAQIINDLKSFMRMSSLYSPQFKQHAINKEILGSSKTLQEIEDKINHPRGEGNIQLMEIPGLVRFTHHHIIIGQKRTIYFATDVTAIQLYDFIKKMIMKDDVLKNLEAHIQKPIFHAVDNDSRRRIPPSRDYDILFTVLNPEPERLNITLDLERAIEEYVTPYLKNLQDLNGFSVKSQWLYFVNLQVTTKFVSASEFGEHYALSQDLLTHVITPLEKKLATHVSKNPCLNFVLWIPPCHMAPLHIYTSKGYKVKGADAFLSPQWGGIQIYNPDGDKCLEGGKVVVNPSTKRIMSIFLQQLRLLLGITDVKDISEDPVLKNSSVHVRQWEKDNLIRIRTIEQLTSAKLTLQSLSQLLFEINNIVINDDVGESIYSSLNHVYESTEALKSSQLMRAYKTSKQAFLSAEDAFTHPSLLALLYFPDDQKYAVYIPLFLPVMIPVIISFKALKDWWVMKPVVEKAKVD